MVPVPLRSGVTGLAEGDSPARPHAGPRGRLAPSISARRGLDWDTARRTLAEIGPNAIAEARRTSPQRLFFGKLVHLFALLLWAGALLAWIGGMLELAAAIVVVIVVNAVFAFVQEYRAERAVAALRALLPQRVHVRRDGVVAEIVSGDVVPGDVLVLAAGDRICADATLLGHQNLRVDESTLTGESYPVEPAENVFAGTYVTAGTGEALVTATGMRTRFGRIAELAQETRPARSPLELELDRVTRLVAALSIGTGTLFFLVAGAFGMGLSDRFVFSIGVMVALVPEGLLPTVTLSLALATQRMARRNALVRRLSSVETLGETTVICTDKTGTLTENEMTVRRLWTPAATAEIEGQGYEPFGRFRVAGAVVDPRRFHELLRAALLCNDARLVQAGSGWAIVGDPTEGALVVAAEKGGLRHEQETAQFPRLEEIPFSSERRRMTTVHLDGSERVAYAKGAPEVIVPLTTSSTGEKQRALDAAGALERDALRVLAVARRRLPEGANGAGEIERDLDLLGLVGLADPPRPEIQSAVRQCRRAGIRVVMVTGDSPATAAAIAREVGLADTGTRTLTGPQLAELDDTELAERLARGNVIFARIDPEQKLRLARLLRAQGEIVAMTGDGVNDAPALKEADIGVAMGRSGTEVAKESADIVLLDDNFASVVAAVEEGRAVYDNIRRFAGYHFCSNVAELVPFLVWGMTGGAVPLPLVVMQVLAIDLGTDMLPAIALGTERAEPGTMDRAPRPRDERLLNRATLGRIFAWIGPLEGLAALTSFLFTFWLVGWRPGESLPDSGGVYVQATAMTYAAIVLSQVGAGLAWRTTRRSILEVGLLSNRLLLIGIVVELALVSVLTETPRLQRIFHMQPLPLWGWLVLLVWPPFILATEELRKLAVRRRAARPAARSGIAASPSSTARHGS
jgi:magnesium-transporting ATPase (P-type)